jgi:hypothetical protein
MTTATGRKADQREQQLGELRGGAEGVGRWNSRPDEERAAAGPYRAADLSGADLPGVNLGGLDFQGARFDGAKMTEAWLLESDLRGASFKKADLAQAWCVGAKFQGTDFEGASLARCNLRTCDFHDARLAGVDLHGASLDGANLCGADLTAADLTGASFRAAKYNEKTRWPRGTEEPQGAEWVGSGSPPLDFDLFLKRLERYVDPKRLARAVEMLKAERFQLYTRAENDSLVGVVRSQTDPGLVYSCRIAADGSFGCCTQNLVLCLGFPRSVGRVTAQGMLCKHLLVLIVGLARKDEIDRGKVDAWLRACRDKRPTLDVDAMSETLLRYKGAQAGEIDWRPTETIPEDYYAL